MVPISCPITRDQSVHIMATCAQPVRPSFRCAAAYNARRARGFPPARRRCSAATAAAASDEETASHSDVDRANLEAAATARLQALMPGHDAHAMVERCPELLDVSPRAFATRLMQLQTLLPGLDVLDVAAAQPRLLTLPDVADVVSESISKLESLCPDDYCPADALGIVEENPELLLRLQHFNANDDFSRLPMDVQNMLVVGGGGGGAGWKSWQDDDVF